MSYQEFYNTMKSKGEVITTIVEFGNTNYEAAEEMQEGSSCHRVDQ